MADAWFDRLQQSLSQAEHTPAVWSLPTSAGRLMFIPRMGRLIACQMPGVAGNLFYHHPDLEKPGRVGDILQTAGGTPGGDRLWIAPESAYCWKDLAQARHDLAAHAAVPPAMDPADYRIQAAGPGRLELVTQMALHDGRHDQSLSLRVVRSFQSIDAPAGLPGDVACLSFATTHDLTMLEAGPASQAGAWSLLQLPPVGTLVCPTVGQATQPRSYYDPFGPSHVKVEGQAVRFLVDSRRRIKMGIRPEQTTGRMGFHRRVGQVDTLIVRIFHPQPGRPYVDLPVDDILAGQRLGGDAMQAYNHDGSGGLSFGEMEFQDPALLAGSPSRTMTSHAVTHILAGPADAIRQAGRSLLGVELE